MIAEQEKEKDERMLLEVSEAAHNNHEHSQAVIEGRSFIKIKRNV